MDYSDCSSELSSLMSRSPTPPSNFCIPYQSPPSSQQSTRGTPFPDGNSSTCASSAEDEDSRPAKRRRVTPAMPRDTKRLDLADLSERPDPEQQAELDRLLKSLRKSRKIVVVAGAGISVSAGIPDFRSSTGLFNSLKAQHNLKGSGKELFDAAVYRDSSSTSSFHDMVRSLSTLTKSAKPTPFHHLLARLAHEGRLLRLYSQNVDGIDTSLEPLATKVPLPAKGPWPKTIQLHGGLEKMICTKCQHLSDFKADLFDGPTPPECEQCRQADFARTEVAGKRSHGIGKLRPRMVLYNEHNPDDEAIGAVTKADLRRRPDAIIVVGTSLKIPGVKRIVREMCSIVRNHRDGLAVWINNDPEPTAKEFENCWDLIIKGTCDEVAEHAAMRKWDDGDDLVDSRVVTEEEMRLAKENGEPRVIVNTPMKLKRFKDVDSLPTPAHTPRPDGSTLDIEGDQSEPKLPNPVSKITLNLIKLVNGTKPALNSTQKNAKTAKEKKIARAANPRRTKTMGGPKSAPKKPSATKKKQQDDIQNSKLTFKVKKPTSSAAKVEETKNVENVDKVDNDCSTGSVKQSQPAKSVSKNFKKLQLPIPTTVHHNLSNTFKGESGRSDVSVKSEMSLNRLINTSNPSSRAGELLQTPKKYATIRARLTPSIERPPVSPLTPMRPTLSPFTECKRLPGSSSSASYLGNGKVRSFASRLNEAARLGEESSA